MVDSVYVLMSCGGRETENHIWWIKLNVTTSLIRGAGSDGGFYDIWFNAKASKKDKMIR